MCVRLRELWQFDVVCARLGTLVGPWERATGVRDNFGTHSQLARLALRGDTAVLHSSEATPIPVPVAIDARATQKRSLQTASPLTQAG